MSGKVEELARKARLLGPAWNTYPAPPFDGGSRLMAVSLFESAAVHEASTVKELREAAGPSGLAGVRYPASLLRRVFSRGS